MTAGIEKSANEIETLVLKAARGGGLALGLAEDLAAAAAYLDLDDLTTCPCTGDRPAAHQISTALDLVAAGAGPQVVVADRALIIAYVTAFEAQMRQRVEWSAQDNGAVFHAVVPATSTSPKRSGRRNISTGSATHLADMAAKLLVPETDASRRAGAGAGLTDND